MPDEHSHTDAFRGARFTAADFTGATFRDCDLTQVRIVSSQIADLRVSGFDGCAGTVVVDDVDVTAFVAAELDRRHPERVQLRVMRTAQDHRAMWDALDHLWSDTVARADQLPESARHERVDGEWSFVETVRHLVFAIDSWAGRMILDEPAAYHRLGLPPTDYPTAGAHQLGIDLTAHPSAAEVMAVYAERKARMQAVVEALTDDSLLEIRTAALEPSSDVESHTVGACLHVVMNEHCEHRRFALRDLAVLDAR